MSETNQPHFTNVLDSFGQPLLSDEIPQQEIVEKSGFLKMFPENTDKLADEFAENGTVKHFCIRQGFLPDDEQKAEQLLISIIREWSELKPL